VDEAMHLDQLAFSHRNHAVGRATKCGVEALDFFPYSNCLALNQDREAEQPLRCEVSVDLALFVPT
jgi:hypothetical protein